jgi:hypothetical protein
MQKGISFKPTEEECFACEYFIKTDARRGYADAARSQLLKNYQKIPKDRRTKHEKECRDRWDREKSDV